MMIDLTELRRMIERAPRGALVGRAWLEKVERELIAARQATGATQ
jgi:hypothetical protein